MINERKQRRAGAFFGRRKAKSLKPSQIVLFEQLLPKLKLDLSEPAPGNLNQLFEGDADKIILEIGFGGGEHLLQRCGEQVGDGFIGCEPFVNGMGTALSEIAKNQISNLRLFDEDATWLLNWLPPHSVDIIYLLYPDPWPKRRHWKRRFVNEENLRRFARVLKSGGEFRFASDIAHYVNWTVNHIDRNADFRWSAETTNDWSKPWHGWKSTRYEKKAIREGRNSAYLTFERL
jgi:tRNA (guanine-N7-)-methyltransferase